jgi:hypothetical protein
VTGVQTCALPISLPNSGLGFTSGWTPYVCCGINFGPTTQAAGGPFEL